MQARTAVGVAALAIASDAVAFFLARIGQDDGAVRRNLLAPSLQIDAPTTR